MGRFGITARVVTPDGNGEIVDKRKGERLVRLDQTDLPVTWFRKSELQVEAPWVPKVGDRVKPKPAHDAWARGHWQNHWSKAGPLDDMFVAAEGYSSDSFRLSNKVGGDGPFWTTEEFDLVEPASTAAAAGLRIEAGKFYRTRDGRKVGPAYVDGDTATFGARDNHLSAVWTHNGRQSAPNDLTTELSGDILAEWPEADEPVIAIESTTAEPTPERKFKVGDKMVRIEDGASWAPIGYVAEYLDGGYYIDSNGDSTVVVESQWALAPKTAAPKFNVGDRVKSSGNRDYEYIVRAVHDDSLDVTVIEFDGSEGFFYGGAPIGKFSLVEPAQPVASAPTESFIVARLTASGQPRPAARPFVHASLAAAADEAQRLADQLGDEFAVYRRVDVRSIDAGPVPPVPVYLLKGALSNNRELAGAFTWSRTKQGHSFWNVQHDSGLTPLGRAILRKWIAEAEAATTAEEPA